MYLKQTAEILVFDNIPKTSTQAPRITHHPSAGPPAPPTPNVGAVVYHGMTLPRWNNGWYETTYGWGWKSQGTHGSLRFAALKLVSCFVFGKMSEEIRIASLEGHIIIYDIYIYILYSIIVFHSANV